MMSDIDKKKQQSQNPPEKQPLETIDHKAIALAEEKELLFGRHLANKLSYEDYDSKSKKLDSFVFDWATNGVDVLSKYLPLTTRLVSE